MTERPNLVLVTVDSLRADHCGFMGADGDPTPTLDRLAREGLVFENAVAPGPSTLDAMPAIFTGMDIPDPQDGRRVEGRERFVHHLRAHGTFAQRLSALGYETGAFTANPWTSRYYGFDRGFDHFEDFMGGEHADGARERASLPTDSKLRYGVGLLRNWRRQSDMFKSWESFYDEAVAWTERATEPYFLWLFLVDVHMPYLPPAEFRTGTLASTLAANLWLYLGRHDPDRFESVFREPLVRAYRDTVRYTDAKLGQLTDDLADDDPVIVVHADHGEAFGDHGVYGHGLTVHEEMVHVPLVVANGPTGAVERPFSLARLPDLLAGLATGEDVTRLAEPYVGTRNRDPKFAVRGREWKYVDADGAGELYDLAAGERTRLDDERLCALGERVVDHWKAAEAERKHLVAATRDLAEEHRL